VSGSTDLVYYDGGCGLCHRTVRFLIARDPEGEAFRFAPIQGETFRARVPAERRATLPDSIVLERADGVLLVGSDATAHMLVRLGGGWSVLGRLLGRVPRALREAAYRWVAARRLRWFAAPEASCPVLPDRLRARFEA
jgi:predicted DCC family thiol-disulfide oxidoreductase YuxK